MSTTLDKQEHAALSLQNSLDIYQVRNSNYSRADNLPKRKRQQSTRVFAFKGLVQAPNFTPLCPLNVETDCVSLGQYGHHAKGVMSSLGREGGGE